MELRGDALKNRFWDKFSLSMVNVFTLMVYL